MKIDLIINELDSLNKEYPNSIDFQILNVVPDLVEIIKINSNELFENIKSYDLVVTLMECIDNFYNYELPEVVRNLLRN